MCMTGWKPIPRQKSVQNFIAGDRTCHCYHDNSNSPRMTAVFTQRKDGPSQDLARRATEMDGRETFDGLDLILTACYRRSKILTFVRGQPVYLSFGLFSLLLDLVEGHGRSPFRYVSERATTYPMAVSRLRKAFDDAAGRGVGTTLIETGMGAEYRLSPSATIGVDRQCAIDDGPLARQVLNSSSSLFPRVSIGPELLSAS